VIGRGGEPLEEAVRDLLEAVLGAELGEVRLYRGRVARGVAALLRATAVTFGRRVFFVGAAWSRDRLRTASGLALAAHEVAHVIQYRRDGFFGMLARYLAAYLAGRRRGLGHAGAYRDIGYEREAAAWAAAVDELLRREPEILQIIAAGRRLPAPLRERAAAAGRGVATRGRSRASAPGVP
jgi:hypothetical protein